MLRRAHRKNQHFWDGRDNWKFLIMVASIENFVVFNRILFWVLIIGEYFAVILFIAKLFTNKVWLPYHIIIIWWRILRVARKKILFYQFRLDITFAIWVTDKLISICSISNPFHCILSVFLSLVRSLKYNFGTYFRHFLQYA